ncbi:MAG: hypothetical protein K1060chlam2_01231 [Chlamydiae bacterium]|nr:hypothetical protein [Chlamydiota bacterium]
MRTLLKNLFINNWPRKCLSIILAIIIWFVVNKSLTTTKTISNVPVRIENLPPGKTVEGIQSNGNLGRRVNLTLTGNKNILDDLNPNDIYVVFDASGREGEWIETITRKNIHSDTLEVNISQGISRISQQNFIVKLTKLVTEKVRIIITQPIGESPKGYQFIDIWPYQLYITVSGPEDVVKKLKTRGLKLTFNLNDITKTQLDDLRATSTQEYSDVISFFIPNNWKQISLPLLSSTPIEINDPDAKYLRVDFLRYELLKLETPVPVSLYFPPNKTNSISPSKITLVPNKIVENRNGIKMVTLPLYAKGVSALFLDMVRDMLEILIIVTKSDDGKLKWSTEFVNSRALEDRYVRLLTSDVSDEELRDLQPQVRDEILRNRFRNYMNRFQLYKNETEKFEISPQLKGHSVYIHAD